MTVAEFAGHLLAKGIEVHVRNNRLWIWPAKLYRALSPEDRDFIRAHRHELKELVREGRAPRLPDEKAEPVPPPDIPPLVVEPIVWTADYSRRVTEADVAAAGLRGSTREVYEQTRAWLAKQSPTDIGQPLVDERQARRALRGYLQRQGGTR